MRIGLLTFGVAPSHSSCVCDAGDCSAGELVAISPVTWSSFFEDVSALQSLLVLNSVLLLGSQVCKILSGDGTVRPICADVMPPGMKCIEGAGVRPVPALVDANCWRALFPVRCDDTWPYSGLY